MRANDPLTQWNITWRATSISMRVAAPPGTIGPGLVAAASAAWVWGPSWPSRLRPSTFWKAISE